MAEATVTMAEAFKIKKSQLTLVGGETSRDKSIKITGLSLEQVQQKLEQ